MQLEFTYNVVTSFNAAGYVRYGRRMIEAFRKYWPDSVKLIVVSEDDIPLEVDERLILEHYSVLAPEGEHFKTKFGQFSEARGITYTIDEQQQIRSQYQYVFDAIRFSHKSFSIFGVSRKWDSDRLIWLDADTVTLRPIDERFFLETDPGTGHASYLGRTHMYSECGFICYNRRHPIHDQFLQQIATEYLNGELFLLPHWHDCWMFDVMREHFSKHHGATYRNLSEHVADHSHPFINCVLGEYMDHMKGDARKDAGQSFDEDRITSK